MSIFLNFYLFFGFVRCLFFVFFFFFPISSSNLLLSVVWSFFSPSFFISPLAFLIFPPLPPPPQRQYIQFPLLFVLSVSFLSFWGKEKKFLSLLSRLTNSIEEEISKYVFLVGLVMVWQCCSFFFIIVRGRFCRTLHHCFFSLFFQTNIWGFFSDEYLNNSYMERYINKLKNSFLLLLQLFSSPLLFSFCSSDSWKSRADYSSS